MPKVKIPRKSTSVDMTAMCDVAFLLLNFFMLTSNFTVKEAVLVSTPSSISEIKIPEVSIMTIIIDKDGKVFFGIDGAKRTELLKTVGESYQMAFNDKELRTYSLINSSGVPIEMMKQYLELPMEERDKKENALGIPADSVDNQLKVWIKSARKVDIKAKIAIKADQNATYAVIKNVMKTLQDLDENKYNLITSLEKPAEIVIP
ncbi:MAG: biopolymer transporter ExbD [Salinivirgaceae bacterium]|nr:biopolymer transporter ExbD [Salinivirgaceae bacterium]